MDNLVELKPCPFCGSNGAYTRVALEVGSWVTIVECSTCPAQMQSDTTEAAVTRRNTRAYDPTVRRINNQMKQAEWERNQAVRRLEIAQIIIDLNLGGNMKQELAEAVAILKAQGIEVGVDPSGKHADVYVVTLPSGEEYEFLAAGILKLKAEGKLTAARLEEASSKFGK